LEGKPPTIEQQHGAFLPQQKRGRRSNIEISSCPNNPKVKSFLILVPN
jgi:hypothetical protein